MGYRLNTSPPGNLGSFPPFTKESLHAGQSHGSSLSEELPQPRHSMPNKKFAIRLVKSIKKIRLLL
jgi:hypothetical protein